MLQISTPVFGTTDAQKKEERRYMLKCPQHVAGCTGLFDYTHLMAFPSKPDWFGPWYCDECGWAVTAAGYSHGQMLVTALPERKINTLVLLVLNGASLRDEPIFLVTQGMVFEKNGKIDYSNQEYFYEQHTCPTNFLRADMLVGDDTDPHGIFRYLETVAMPDDWRERDAREIGDYEKLFATLRSAHAMHGQPAKLIMADLIRQQEEKPKLG